MGKGRKGNISLDRKFIDQMREGVLVKREKGKEEGKGKGKGKKERRQKV